MSRILRACSPLLILLAHPQDMNGLVVLVCRKEELRHARENFRVTVHLLWADVLGDLPELVVQLGAEAELEGSRRVPRLLIERDGFLRLPALFAVPSCSQHLVRIPGAEREAHELVVQVMALSKPEGVANTPRSMIEIDGLFGPPVRLELAGEVVARAAIPALGADLQRGLHALAEASEAAKRQVVLGFPVLSCCGLVFALGLQILCEPLIHLLIAGRFHVLLHLALEIVLVQDTGDLRLRR